MTPAQLQVVYGEAWDELDGIRKELVNWLDNLFKGLGLHEPQVRGRTKSVHSMVMKQIIKGYSDPMSQVSDKVGLRVDVAYLSEVPLVVDAVRASPEVIVDDVEDLEARLDKMRVDKASTLVYPGINIDLRPVARTADVREEWTKCELQVRTMGQAAWAVSGHDLTYKPPEGMRVDWRLKRRVQLLLSLL